MAEVTCCLAVYSVPALSPIGQKMYLWGLTLLSSFDDKIELNEQINHNLVA